MQSKYCLLNGDLRRSDPPLDEKSCNLRVGTRNAFEYSQLRLEVAR